MRWRFRLRHEKLVCSREDDGTLRISAEVEFRRDAIERLDDYEIWFPETGEPGGRPARRGYFGDPARATAGEGIPYQNIDERNIEVPTGARFVRIRIFEASPNRFTRSYTFPIPSL